MRRCSPARLATLGMVLTAVLVAINGFAQQDRPDLGDAREAMSTFLSAWLAGDGDTAMSYFGVSQQSTRLAPDSVWRDVATDLDAEESAAFRAAYWRLINDVWQPEPPQGETGQAAGVGRELIQAFEEEFEVPIISTSEDRFLAFEASTDVSIYVFDAANKGAARVLKETDRLTLGMIAGIPTTRMTGPFVAFWQQEGDTWLIQMVGGIRP